MLNYSIISFILPKWSIHQPHPPQSCDTSTPCPRATLGFILKLTYSQASFWRETSSSIQRRSKVWPRGWFARAREPKCEPYQQQVPVPRAPSPVAARCVSSDACTSCPTILNLSPGFKNSIAVGCVIFGA